ncbi:hypothetical protein, partial [Streptomyces anulatus]
ESRGAAPDPAPQSPEGLDFAGSAGSRGQGLEVARSAEAGPQELEIARSAGAEPRTLGEAAVVHVDQEAK